MLKNSKKIAIFVILAATYKACAMQQVSRKSPSLASSAVLAARTSTQTARQAAAQTGLARTALENPSLVERYRSTFSMPKEHVQPEASNKAMKERSLKGLAPYIIGGGMVAGTGLSLDDNYKNITPEFCKETEIQEKKCQEFEVFKEDTGNKYYYVRLQDRKTKEEIGFLAYGISEDGNLRIDLLSVEDKFQKMGYGSKLLTYALSQCGKNCQYASLVASPLYARLDEEKPSQFKKLERFYAKHGGKVLSQDDGVLGQPVRGTMYFSDTL